MKIYMTARNQGLKNSRYRQQLNAVENLLDRHHLVDKRLFFKHLAKLLLFPESYFISLPADEVSALVEKTFQFLEQKNKTISHHFIQPDQDNWLLLINCPVSPYIIDSIVNLQRRHNDSFTLLAHPVVKIERHSGEITSFGNDRYSGIEELCMVIRMENKNPQLRASQEDEIFKVVSTALQAYQSRFEVNTKLNELRHNQGFKQWTGFIDWLIEKAFTPLIYQRFSKDECARFSTQGKIANTIYLGMEIDDYHGPDYSEQLYKVLTRETELIVQTTPVISPIITSQPLIYIGFREQQGSTWAEHSFLGLFRETELNGNACNVAPLCKKIAKTLDRAKISRESYEYYQLQEWFNLFPKVELFFLGETQLNILTQALIEYLYRQEVIKLLILSSSSPFTISVLLIIPHHIYREGIESVLQQKLVKELSCSLDSSRKIISGGQYIGLQLIMTPENEVNRIDVFVLEKDLNRLAKPWDLRFRLLLERAYGKDRSHGLCRRYMKSFSTDYQALMPPRYAVKDMQCIEKVLKTHTPCISLFGPCYELQNHRLQFYSHHEQFLDEYIPVLENMNLRLIDQVQFSVHIDAVTIFIKSFAIKIAVSGTQTLTVLKPHILEAVQAILDGKAENDALNSLIVSAEMTWKEVDVIRAYRNYCLQLGIHSSQDSFHRALLNNPRATRCIYDYFESRFRPNDEWDDPVLREEQALFPLRLKLLENIEAVKNINDDRILRTLFNLIDATVRSNFHVRSQEEDYFFAFKINSLGIIDMPAPRPQFEIYVHAVSMEGIHLRGGKISRGGIRWSDRPDDFRTEILGLMQTQMSKNALIIPKGAKGGFIVKNPGKVKDFRESGKNAYKTLIRGLLDVTDNYRDDKVHKLSGLVTYDRHDPYLVVAADKGTAQFPDIANAVAREYDFWLKDAFASGGSRGYNHKVLGITARGAWESVKRHFRERGKDIQTQPFSVVGIGSMDGDVFGNGMLLSKCIRLLAAVSGQHIFIDPDPEPESSFVERKRLFDLQGSSWADYKQDLISKGGGVYSRHEKSIPLSPEVRKWLGIRYRTLDGESLIRYLLVAPIELLWLGGIGTYVKASIEKQEQAGDRNNDSVRVDASAIQAHVVGEGANLGFTQKARIEYSLKKGLINTDAIDNSAGVDCSDHEVNLKILLYDLHKKKRITDYQQLFVDITNEVCQSVLANNYSQSLCISLDLIRCNNNPDAFLKMADRLESAGFLDRSVESFPSFKGVHARQNHSLARPELAVLMAASKMLLTQQLQEDDRAIVADYSKRYLQDYFPERINTPFQKDLENHPLAREIIATCISNIVINQAGCSFFILNTEMVNEDVVEYVSSYLVFDQVVNGTKLRKSVYELDNNVDCEIQYRLLILLENILAGFCRWTLRNHCEIKLNKEVIDCYTAYMKEHQTYYHEHDCHYHEKDQLDQYLKSGIPVELARQILFIASLEDFPQIVGLTIETGGNFTDILFKFNEMSEFLGLNLVYEQLASLSVHDHWEGEVMNDLQENFKSAVGKLTVKLVTSDYDSCRDYFTANDIKPVHKKYQRVYQEVSSILPSGLLPLIALSKALETLAG